MGKHFSFPASSIQFSKDGFSYLMLDIKIKQKIKAC